jgi:sec-independent protein translocase protein TatA
MPKAIIRPRPGGIKRFDSTTMPNFMRNSDSSRNFVAIEGRRVVAGLSIWHWLIVGGIVTLLIGKGRPSDLMGDVAKGVKSSKKGLVEELEHDAPQPGLFQHNPPIADISAAIIRGRSQGLRQRNASGEVGVGEVANG